MALIWSCCISLLPTSVAHSDKCLTYEVIDPLPHFLSFVIPSTPVLFEHLQVSFPCFPSSLKAL